MKTIITLLAPAFLVTSSASAGDYVMRAERFEMKKTVCNTGKYVIT